MFQEIECFLSDLNDEKNSLELSFLFPESQKIMNDSIILYNSSKYLEAEIKLKYLFEKYHDNVDIACNYACALFENKKYLEAIEIFKISTKIINSYHCYFHYIGSALHYNRGGILKLLRRNEEALQDFAKSKFLFI